MKDDINRNSSSHTHAAPTPHRTAQARRLIARSLPACPACGAQARRSSARFCSTCGRRLDENRYIPSDHLRASYHRRSASNTAQRVHSPKPSSTALKGGSKKKHEAISSAILLAFLAYALVPYLGILFCPGAIVAGSINLLRARHTQQLQEHSRRVATAGILVGLLIFCVQLFLWWVLYKAPEWANQ